MSGTRPPSSISGADSSLPGRDRLAVDRAGRDEHVAVGRHRGRGLTTSAGKYADESTIGVEAPAGQRGEAARVAVAAHVLGLREELRPGGQAAVEERDGVPAPDRRGRDVAPDEARAADDEEAHAAA